MLTPDTLRDALLADNTGAVGEWLAAGGDADLVMDDQGGRPLFFACTAAMARALLAAGADPRLRRPDGTSVLDAAAIEGQTELVRVLLGAAPDLATEARALLAADHPDTEMFIRAVARGDRTGESAAASGTRLSLRQVPYRYDPGAPSPKGAQRYYTLRYDEMPIHRGELHPEQVPAWAVRHMAEDGDAVAFTGPGTSVLIFTEAGPPLLVTEDGATELDAPPMKYTYEHAYDEAGTHIFLGYGQGKVIGVDARTGERVVDVDLPGAPWGRALVGLGNEDLRGHSYPVRLAVVGGWLVLSSLERIYFLPFGDNADLPAQWWTCQFGTCVAALRGGRVVLVGARSGGVVFGLHDRRVERLADLPAPADEAPSALHGHLRMALRVTGNGHDDVRSLKVERWGDATEVIALGVGGFFQESTYIRGLTVDPDELAETWPTAPEIVDVFELDGEAHLRVSPIGKDWVRSYVVEGLDALWDAAFAPAPKPRTRGPLAITPAPLPRSYNPPHRDIGTLSYPGTGPAGYAFGYKVSSRPGFWNSYVVDGKGVHPLTPHWYNGITVTAFHDTGARMLAASGREAIEIDLATRKWRRREYDVPVRGVCYFDSGIAVLLPRELRLQPDLEADATLSLPTTTRASAQMGSLHGHRVLFVPVGDDGNVFLVRRDGELCVAGVLRAPATGYHQSPDGEFLATPDRALTLPDWDAALPRAVPVAGRSLDKCRSPRITIRT